jgi:hypothetical protein
MGDLKRTARAVSTRGLRRGKGHIDAQSGVLEDSGYTFKTR